MSLYNQMETSALFFFFIFFFFFTHTAFCADFCKPFSCGNTQIRSPFWITEPRTIPCGHPGFDLSCNNRSQTLLNLPRSGDYIVRRIDYALQQIYIDPDFCNLNRILSFNLSGSPFTSAYIRHYTFYNCSSPLPDMMSPAEIITCLGSDNYTVIAVPCSSFPVELPASCRNISTASLPPQQRITPSGTPIGDLQLTWVEPDCTSEAGGGTRNRGLPRAAKYGIIVGVGIPALLCLIRLACCICSRIKAYTRRGRLTTELSTTTFIPQQSVFLTGLDGPTIESYPKTVLGESRRLPKPNDGTCSICLSEYQPKDTLRTIPECNHYFHANCIDEWLRLNATCPVCRNSPESSSVVTPCSSVSSSTTLASSSS